MRARSIKNTMRFERVISSRDVFGLDPRNYWDKLRAYDALKFKKTCYLSWSGEVKYSALPGMFQKKIIRSGSIFFLFDDPDYKPDGMWSFYGMIFSSGKEFKKKKLIKPSPLEINKLIIQDDYETSIIINRKDYIKKDFEIYRIRGVYI